MERTDSHKPVMDLEARVRANTGPAALAAGLLIFFGFFSIERPEGSDLWAKAAVVFYHTIRWGGLAMVGLAAWSSLGDGPALFADAVVSCIIGVIMVVTGGLMLIDAGVVLRCVVYMICGVMFLALGIRNGRDFLRFARSEDSDDLEVLEQIGSIFPSGSAVDGSNPGVSASAGPGTEPTHKPINMAAVPKHRRPGSAPAGRYAASDETIRLPDLDPGGALADVEPLRPPQELADEETRPPDGAPPPGGPD